MSEYTHAHLGVLGCQSTHMLIWVSQCTDIWGCQIMWMLIQGVLWCHRKYIPMWESVFTYIKEKNAHPNVHLGVRMYRHLRVSEYMDSYLGCRMMSEWKHSHLGVSIHIHLRVLEYMDAPVGVCVKLDYSNAHLGVSNSKHPRVSECSMSDAYSMRIQTQCEQRCEW